MAKSFNSHDIKKEVVGWFSDPKLRLKNSPTSPFNLEIYEKANSQEEFKHISELVEKEWELIAADLKRDARFQEIGDELLKSSLKVIAYWQFAKIVDEDDRIASFNELGNQYVNKDKSADNAEHDEEIQQDFKVAIEQTVQSALYQAQQASIGAAFTEEIQKSIPERLLTLQDIKQVEELLFDADYLWDTYLKVRERKEHHEFIERHRKEYIEKIVEDKWSEIKQTQGIKELVENQKLNHQLDYGELFKLVLHKQTGTDLSLSELLEVYPHTGADFYETNSLHVDWIWAQECDKSVLDSVKPSLQKHFFYKHLFFSYFTLTKDLLFYLSDGYGYFLPKSSFQTLIEQQDCVEISHRESYSPPTTDHSFAFEKYQHNLRNQLIEIMKNILEGQTTFIDEKEAIEKITRNGGYLYEEDLSPIAKKRDFIKQYINVVKNVSGGWGSARGYWSSQSRQYFWGINEMDEKIKKSLYLIFQDKADRRLDSFATILYYAARKGWYDKHSQFKGEDEAFSGIKLIAKGSPIHEMVMGREKLVFEEAIFSNAAQAETAKSISYYAAKAKFEESTRKNFEVGVAKAEFEEAEFNFKFWEERHNLFEKLKTTQVDTDGNELDEIDKRIEELKKNLNQPKSENLNKVLKDALAFKKNFTNSKHSYTQYNELAKKMKEECDKIGGQKAIYTAKAIKKIASKFIDIEKELLGILKTKREVIDGNALEGHPNKDIAVAHIKDKVLIGLNKNSSIKYIDRASKLLSKNILKFYLESLEFAKDGIEQFVNANKSKFERSKVKDIQGRYIILKLSKLLGYDFGSERSGKNDDEIPDTLDDHLEKFTDYILHSNKGIKLLIDAASESNSEIILGGSKDLDPDFTDHAERCVIEYIFSHHDLIKDLTEANEKKTVNVYIGNNKLACIFCAAVLNSLNTGVIKNLVFGYRGNHGELPPSKSFEYVSNQKLLNTNFFSAKTFKYDKNWDHKGHKRNLGDLIVTEIEKLKKATYSKVINSHVSPEKELKDKDEFDLKSYIKQEINEEIANIKNNKSKESSSFFKWCNQTIDKLKNILEEIENIGVSKLLSSLLEDETAKLERVKDCAMEKEISITDSNDNLETDIAANPNPYNQGGNLSYSYEKDDIDKIGNQIIRQLNEGRKVEELGAQLKWLGILETDNLPDINEVEKCIGILHTSGEEGEKWVAIVIVKNEDGYSVLSNEKIGDDLRENIEGMYGDAKSNELVKFIDNGTKITPSINREQLSRLEGIWNSYNNCFQFFYHAMADNSSFHMCHNSIEKKVAEVKSLVNKFKDESDAIEVNSIIALLDKESLEYAKYCVAIANNVVLQDNDITSNLKEVLKNGEPFYKKVENEANNLRKELESVAKSDDDGLYFAAIEQNPNPTSSAIYALRDAEKIGKWLARTGVGAEQDHKGFKALFVSNNEQLVEKFEKLEISKEDQLNKNFEEKLELNDDFTEAKQVKDASPKSEGDEVELPIEESEQQLREKFGKLYLDYYVDKEWEKNVIDLVGLSSSLEKLQKYLSNFSPKKFVDGDKQEILSNEVLDSIKDGLQKLSSVKQDDWPDLSLKWEQWDSAMSSSALKVVKKNVRNFRNEVTKIASNLNGLIEDLEEDNEERSDSLQYDADYKRLILRKEAEIKKEIKEKLSASAPQINIHDKQDVPEASSEDNTQALDFSTQMRLVKFLYDKCRKKWANEQDVEKHITDDKLLEGFSNKKELSTVIRDNIGKEWNQELKNELEEQLRASKIGEQNLYQALGEHIDKIERIAASRFVLDNVFINQAKELIHSTAQEEAMELRNKLLNEALPKYNKVIVKLQKSLRERQQEDAEEFLGALFSRIRDSHTEIKQTLVLDENKKDNYKEKEVDKKPLFIMPIEIKKGVVSKFSDLFKKATEDEILNRHIEIISRKDEEVIQRIEITDDKEKNIRDLIKEIVNTQGVSIKFDNQYINTQEAVDNIQSLSLEGGKIEELTGRIVAVDHILKFQDNRVAFEEAITNGNETNVDTKRVTFWEIGDQREIVFSLKRFASFTTGETTKLKDKVDFDDIEINDKQYEITAFIVHKGDTQRAGHYIAYIKERDLKWHIYDDFNKNGVEVTDNIEKEMNEAYIVKYSVKNDSEYSLPEPQVNLQNTGNSCWLDASLIFARSFTTLHDTLTNFLKKNDTNKEIADATKFYFEKESSDIVQNNIGEYAGAVDAVNLNYAGNHYAATIQNADDTDELEGAMHTEKEQAHSAAMGYAINESLIDQKQKEIQNNYEMAILAKARVTYNKARFSEDSNSWPSQSEEGSDNELDGAMHTGKGMSCEAVNMNLVEMCKANNNKELKISPEVIDGATVAFSIKDWLNDDEVITKFTAVVKVENENGCSHAVTVIAKRDGDNVTVQITDSLPQKESSFKEVLEELKAQVQSALGENSEVTIIRTGEQNEGSATCGDLSLIRISELALKNDKEYNGYTEKVTKFLSYKYDNHVFLDEKLNAQIAHANNGGMIFDSLHRAIEEGVVEEMEYGLINQCSSEDFHNEKAFNKSFYAAKKAILEAFNNQDYGLIDEILLTFDPIHRSDLLNIRYGDVGYVTCRIVRLESGSYISKAYVQQIGYNEHDVRSSDDQIIPLSLSFEHEGIDAVNAMRLDSGPLKFVIFDSESY